MRAFTRAWFRYELRGPRVLPEQACLFVGNHSGLGVADVLCFMGARGKEPYAKRAMVGLMHDWLVEAPFFGWFCSIMGGTRATPEAGRAAIQAGTDVVVFPGGNLDSCRPVQHARKVVFGDRRGYARLALETGAPVVPIATLGSHATYLLVPWLGPQLGKALRAAGWSRDEIVPMPFALFVLLGTVALALLGTISAWWIAAAAVALVLPNPLRITSDVLAPIDVRAATAHIADPEARVNAAHDLVHGALANHVATMQHRPR